MRLKKFDEFRFENKFRSAQFVLFCIEAVFALTLLISGFNFLAVVGIVLSMAFAVWALLSIAVRNYCSIWTMASFICSDASLLLWYYIWGAGTPAERFGYPLLFTLIPIALAVLILFFPKLLKQGKTRIFGSLCAVVMIGVTLMMALAGSFRARPTVESMKQGHDDYLNSITKEKTTARPNVLFILMDDMGYSDISLYSYLNGTEKDPTIKTPNIDSIAEDGGIYFENFYASSPVCSPSRFGILTGRYCSRGYLDNVVFPSKVSLSPFGTTRYFNPFQFLNNVDGILGDEITFAEVMQRAGYSTALFGKWNLGDYGEYLPTNQGFDYFYGSHYVNDMTPYNFVEERNGEFTEVFTHAQMKDQSDTTERITKVMNPYLEKQCDDYLLNNDKPFLNYYCTPWPHAPLYSSNNTTSQGNAATKGDTTDDTYIDNIEEFDRFLGTTLQVLKDKGVYDDTIIIFTSDNGPGKEGATGALKGRKNTTFEGGHKVPMLVHYGNNLKTDKSVTITNTKGEEKQTYCIEASYMNTDIFPTLLDYMGLPLPTDRIIDGVSMKGVLEGEDGYGYNDTVQKDGENRPLYYIKKGKVQSMQVAVKVEKIGDDGKVIPGEYVTYDFKYFERVRNENSAFIDQVYHNYLFNLDLDPIEGYNVAKTYTSVAKQLDNQLKAFRKSLKENRRGIIK